MEYYNIFSMEGDPIVVSVYNAVQHLMAVLEAVDDQFDLVGTLSFT